MYIPSMEEKEQICAFVTSNRAKLAYMMRKQLNLPAEDDFEECISRFYLTAFENFDKYRSSPNKTGWLFLTFKNTVFDYRREKIRSGMCDELTEERAELVKDGYREDDTIFGILTEHLPEKALAEIVLSELSEEELTLYDMRFRRKLRPRAIAEKLGISESGARRRISELKRKIRDTVHGGKLFERIKDMRRKS